MSDKQSARKRKGAAADVTDVEPEQAAATLARIKPQLKARDFEFIERMWNTLMLVMRLVRAQRASIARLRRMFGIASSEKTRDVTGECRRMRRNSRPATRRDQSQQQLGRRHRSG